MYAPNVEKPYTGRVFDFYENGQKKLNGRYRKGLMTGQWKYYYENGHKKEVGIYKDGEQEGKWTYWFENGQKESEGKYEDGLRSAEWIFWNENGDLNRSIYYDDGREAVEVALDMMKEIAKLDYGDRWYDEIIEYLEEVNKHSTQDVKLLYLLG